MRRASNARCRREMSFVRRRFNALWAAQAFGGLGALVLYASIVDAIVVGNLVGVDGLAGVAAVLPMVVGAQFVSRLVFCGSGYLFAKYQGQVEPDKARRVVGLSLEAAAVVGLAIFTVSCLGRDLYLDAMGISGAVREQAVAYWRWIFVYYAFFPVFRVLWRLVYADGEMVTTTVADVFVPPTNIILSIVFTKMTGSAAGAALGLMAGDLTGVSIMSIHLLRKSNGVVPIWNFSWRGLRELVSYALTDSVAKLCQCGFLAVVSKLVVMTASAAFLPVVSLVALVQQLCDYLDRVGDAYMPIAGMYHGESNWPRLGELARYALSWSFAIGVLLVVAVELLAPQIVTLYGIPGGEVFDSAVIALRLSGVVLPLAAVLLFLCSHYLVLDRIRLSLATTVSFGFLLTTGCTAALCFACGLDAMWLGLPLGAFLTLAALAVYCRVSARRYSLLLLPEGTSAVFNRSFVPEARQVVRARGDGERFLREQGVGADVVSRIMLLIEECSMAVADAGRRTRTPLVEVSLVVDERAATLVLRDTGVTRDITDTDAQAKSLRDFVIAGLMSSYESCRYLNTIGCNRSVFSFRLSLGRKVDPSYKRRQA